MLMKLRPINQNYKDFLFRIVNNQVSFRFLGNFFLRRGLIAKTHKLLFSVLMPNLVYHRFLAAGERYRMHIRFVSRFIRKRKRFVPTVAPIRFQRAWVWRTFATLLLSKKGSAYKHFQTDLIQFLKPNPTSPLVLKAQALYKEADSNKIFVTKSKVYKVAPKLTPRVLSNFDLYCANLAIRFRLARAYNFDNPVYYRVFLRLRALIRKMFSYKSHKLLAKFLRKYMKYLR